MKTLARMTQYAIRNSQSRDWLIALALFAASLALYARTAAPGLLDGDEGEFQTNIGILGVSHTGYPLFFLLGKLFTLLAPIGTVATRTNLFAAFWGAVTVVALFGFARWLTGNRWVALVSAMLLAASRVEWSQAVIPRPYTLNSFLVIVVTMLFLMWRAGKVDLTVPVFAFGLSLTNHRTMIWFAPAIAMLVLWRERGAIFQSRRLVSLASAFVAPLLLYGYIFWRGESDVGVEFHMKDFGEMVLGGNASRWMQYGPFDWLVARVTDLYVPLLVEQFTPLTIIAGIIGMLALALNRAPRSFPRALPARETLIFVALANLSNSLFCFFFNTYDVEKFFLPSYITFLFFAAVGVAVIWEWLAAKPLHVITTSALAFVFMATSGWLVIQNYTRNDWSQRTEVATAWRDNLALPIEQRALIVGPWESLTPLEYAQYVDGQRRDIERWKVITQKQYLTLAQYDSRQADIERAVREGRAVYLTFDPRETETLTALADEFRLVRVGELWRVINLRVANCELRMVNCEIPVTTTHATFTDQAEHSVELVGYAIYPATKLRAGNFGLLTLYWRAPQTISARLSVSMRVLDPAGQIVYQRDAEPANGARPTIGWSADEIVQDDFAFFSPVNGSAGAYRLALVVYNPASGEEWTTAQKTPWLAPEALSITPR
ncbi:MAG: DUF2723 domain-containing protein [Chloroflexi bacterium]|nr:DUF2723 domain-containing protein [Chloroflexota bacterium]